MQPTVQSDQNDGRDNRGFKPRYRSFHPMDRVWVKNPFGHDIRYKVADEHNEPYWYTLPAGAVCELPGGAIATLGVKHIVDELIQNHPQDSKNQWDLPTRKRHEDTIIEEVRSARPQGASDTPREVNLAVDDSPKESNQTQAPSAASEQAFPGLNQRESASAPSQGKQSLSPMVEQGLNDVIASSLPSSNVVVGANNVHGDDSDVVSQ